MLEIKNVSFKVPHGGPEIIKDVSLNVEEGETVVITGPNGSGKTTLAKLIAGLEQPTEGKIYLDGEDITEKSVTERAKSGMAYAFQHPIRFKGLTAKNLIEMAVKREMTDDELCDVLGVVGLCTKDYVHREIDSKLSGGEIKRIEIATVMSRDARVYIFDEPEAGIDLWSFNNLIKVFQHLKQVKNGSIIIISHQERILNIANRIALIEDGKLKSIGPKDEIMPELEYTTGACDRVLV